MSSSRSGMDVEKRIVRSSGGRVWTGWAAMVAFRGGAGYLMLESLYLASVAESEIELDDEMLLLLRLLRLLMV